MTSEKTITPFDHEETFELAIKPLLSEIEGICAREGVPFYYEFAVKNTEQDTKYFRGILAPKGIGLTLCHNTLLAHNLIANGFKAVPPSEEKEINMDDIRDMSSMLDN
jgi:hypothetical protein